MESEGLRIITTVGKLSYELKDPTIADKQRDLLMHEITNRYNPLNIRLYSPRL